MPNKDNNNIVIKKVLQEQNQGHETRINLFEEIEKI